jgi:protein-S-isoprenylcysteine O-methyltransferase Ste14
MIGEQLREAGTLLVVFTPLYELFETNRPSWFVVIGVLILGIAMLVGGIEIERRRA